jgi:hypothetical protein
MAGFEVSTYGRFWVSTEGQEHCERFPDLCRPFDPDVPSADFVLPKILPKPHETP